jgi:hypothetical protein
MCRGRSVQIQKRQDSEVGGRGTTFNLSADHSHLYESEQARVCEVGVSHPHPMGNALRFLQHRLTAQISVQSSQDIVHAASTFKMLVPYPAWIIED